MKVVEKIVMLLVCLALLASTAHAAAYKSCDNYGTKVPSGSWANRRYWGLCCNGNFFAFNKKVTGKKCTKIQLNPPKPQPVPQPSKG